METRMGRQGWRRTWTSAVLAALFGLGLVAAGWVRPEPVAAQQGLADYQRGGPAPGNRWEPPSGGPGHGYRDFPDWRHRRHDDRRYWRHDDWRWRHRHPGWHPGWASGPVYCPGQWVWSPWGWAWAPGC
jgi:hypothetical protein